MKHINVAFDLLIANGFVASQEQFSETFLRKSPRYFAMLKASNRAPSIEAKASLAFGLKRLVGNLENAETASLVILKEAAHDLANDVLDDIGVVSLSREPHKRVVGSNTSQIKSRRNFGQRLLQMTFG